MQSAGREPSMEDILASIKKVIADEKVQRAHITTRIEPEPQPAEAQHDEDEVLELNEPLAPPMDLGPPLLDQGAAETSRQSIETLAAVAASAPPPPTVNPLEEMVREMLRPILKQWLDDNLPKLVDEHVKREITRITGRPLS
jgi:cell pole-organizing protein PopZ